MNYHPGQNILFELDQPLADAWNTRQENETLPGDVFVPAQVGETYPALVIAVREDKIYIKVWPIGGGALNVVIPVTKG